ncbi:MAG: LolA family protein [Chitinophagaceae bacterium]
MKKVILLVLVSLSLTKNTIAQNDPNAKKVLDAVSTKVKSFKGITGSFTIKSITSKGKDNGTKNGTVSIKGQKYILKQGKTEIICDATKIYNYDGSKTVTITPVEESGQTLSPQNLLSNFYDKDFTYKLISSKNAFHEVELLPNDKRKNFTKVNVFIDKVKNMITKAKILDKSNNIIEFTLTNINTNATLGDNLFKFDKNRYPKSIEILD